MGTHMVRWLGLFLSGSLAVLVAGCGGGGGSSGGGSSLFGPSPSDAASGATSSGSGTSNVTASSAGSVIMTLSNATISASTPGTVSAQVKDANGQPMANTLVTFSVGSGTATVSPSRVLTNVNGIAATALVPASGAIGADYVFAAADVNGGSTLTSRVAFTVSAVNVTLTSIAASPTTVPAYGASVVTVDVAGASAASPVTVDFASTCVASGTATLSPATITVTGSTATTTYQDKGCGSTDRVSAVINGTSQQRQVDLAVTAPAAQSLEFVSASPSTICLAGSGCSATSVVSFRLKDQFGNPVAQRDVAFDLDIPNVATLSFAAAKTDNNGIAQVSVSARTVPSPVRVRATVVLAGGATLSTVSNALSINAGLPTQRAFSFSAETYNVDGWSRDGTESSIRLQLNDRFGNPVPDGTVINVVTEGASVIPANCTTLSGVCNVKFVSSNFRPSNGRVTVVAYAQGEESFDDQNGDSVYTLAGDGPNFQDLGPVFVDKNENSIMDTGEYLVGSTADGIWSGNTYVWTSEVFTLSNSAVSPRLFLSTVTSGAGGACTSNTTLAMPLPTDTPAGTGLDLRPSTAACRVQRSFCVRDSNTAADASFGGNPIPAGATLAVSTSAKGAKVSVDNTPVSSTVIGTTRHTITAELDDCSQNITAGGAVDLTITMPRGQSYTYQVGQIR